MNRITTLVFSAILLPLMFPVYGIDNKSTIMKIGYTEGDLCISLGKGTRVITKGAIQFPDAYMERLKGNKITKIRVAIGAPLAEQENSIFITNKLDANPLYTQNIPQLNDGWNEIVLDTPYEITGEELFIGYRYVTSDMTVSFDGSENNDLANWVSVGESDQSLSWYNQKDCGSLNIQAIIEGDKLPQNDASIYSISSKKYAQTARAYPVNLLIRNMAASDINSLDITYTIDGQEPITRTVEDLCIKSNDIGLIHVDDAIIQDAGIYDMDIKISKVNGIINESKTDNQKKIENIICKAEYTKRKVLLEQFSTAKCNNCPNAHKIFEKNLKFRKDDVIWLVHHSGFYTDNLTIDESKSYTYFYGTTSTYAPAAMLDRSNLAQFGALDGNYESTPAPVFNTSSELIPRLLDQRANVPALITVNVDNKYNLNSRSITLAVSGEILSGDVSKLKGSDIRLNIYLVEDSIPGIQSGIEGIYIHNHAIRKVLTNVWGDKINFTSGKYHSEEYTFILPENWKEKNMRIIAFIANSDSNNPNNAQIFNAEEIELTFNSSDVSIQQKKDDSNIEIYAISENLFIKGRYQSAVIYNIAGNMVQAIPQGESKISIATLLKGIYFIKFESSNTSIIKKFLKQ